MANIRYVQPGECVLSIADSAGGMPWKRVWDAPENADLVKLREHPNVLLPGDEVFVPDIMLREEDCATEKKHRFRVKRMVELRVRIHDHNGPRKNERYHLEAEGATFEGETEKTNEEGLAVIRVPPALCRAILVVGPEEDEYELLIGFMDPADTVTGQHARLQNMGYHVGGVQTAWDDASVNALRQFVLDRDAEQQAGNAADSGDKKNHTLLSEEYWA